MNKNEQVTFIVSHLPELTALFHGLFRTGASSTRENKTNAIRYNILKCLQMHGRQYLTDISLCVHYKMNTLSELLDRMVSDGLARREMHAADRRKINFTITAAGVRAIGEFERMFVNNMNDFLHTLPAAERDGFLECLGSLVLISKSCAQSNAEHRKKKYKAR